MLNWTIFTVCNQKMSLNSAAWDIAIHKRSILYKRVDLKHRYCCWGSRQIPLLSISNSYTMGCPPVRGDNPRALASGLSCVKVDKHGITIYTTYINVDIAHHDIFRAKVWNGM